MLITNPRDVENVSVVSLEHSQALLKHLRNSTAIN